MKFNKTLITAVVAGFLLSGCYAYGGDYHREYYDKPSIELDYNYSSRHGVEYNYRYKSYTPRYRHGRHGRYGYPHGRRPYGAVEYRSYRNYGRSYRRECWDHIHKVHYYC